MGFGHLFQDSAKTLTASLQVEFPELPRQGPAPQDAAVIAKYLIGATPQQVFLRVPDPGLTQKMNELLRSRRDWLDIPGAKSAVQRRCVATLFHLGLEVLGIVPLANAGTVEITMPATLPLAWPFPWEFVFAEATRPLRRAAGQVLPKPFLVARHLAGVTTGDVSVPRQLLVVESAPGRLGDEYSFESERRVVISSLELGEPPQIEDPDLDGLVLAVRTHKPDIIHVAGVDSLQGALLLGTPPSAVPGVYLQRDGFPTVVPYEELAQALTADVSPQLVSLNLYNSSIGATELVKKGARAAIGFQDEIDDTVAELFFGAMYGAWKASGFADLPGAYRSAWLALGSQAQKVRGSGIVLWSAVPLIEIAGRPARSKAAAAPETIVRTDVNLADDPDSHFEIIYRAPKQLNYSVLHNDANIFQSFVIKRQKPGVHKGVSVEVRLSAGLEDASYRETFNLDDKNHTVLVHQRVRVPLTAELNRRLDESIFSTVYVTVRWGSHVLLEQTDRVEFLPIDEWKYDRLNGRWLPSFVFPRDPVVRGIVDAAQRYLVALRDDSAAGFDGYQSYDPKGASADERCRGIDAQVQALWWALIYDYPLGYINPPPNFSEDAQRLRTPSDVIHGKRGTCIDLALLLAACLEYIEIYPVVFLLNDHAFPGYWRSESSYDELVTVMMKQPPAPPAPGADAAAVAVTDASWMLGKNRFADITALVQQGHVVPLESVMLTRRSGFWPAIDEGMQNLRSLRHFHSMFDVKTARKYVTPLPIWSKGL